MTTQPLDNPLPIGEDYTPPPPDPRRVDRRETTHCQRKGCTCTHTEDCTTSGCGQWTWGGVCTLHPTARQDTY